MELGLVTYQLAQSWSIEEIIERCSKTGFTTVELRTEHAHGVEPEMPKAQRSEVKQRFADSPVRLVGLGSTCEYHSADPQELRAQIERTKAFVELAADVGAMGVKVRPNRFQEEHGVSKEATLEQIGRALSECGEAAQAAGVEIWLEVHGRETAHPPYIHRIMEVCDHPAVGICWNSNRQDVVDGSVAEYFNLLRPWLRSCHITELWNPDYPYDELFTLLVKTGYDRFTLAEIPGSAEPERLMHYYAALWQRMVKLGQLAQRTS